MTNDHTSMTEDLSAITDLLKAHCIDISARRANEMLKQKGLMITLYRPSFRYLGELRKINVLTGDGLMYGQNISSPVHPIHTQPRFYPETFGLLCHSVLAA